jgi:hypothetical protein
MEEEINEEFEEMIRSMEHIADYDGEFILNTVLDNYKAFIHEDPKIKKKIHKFLNLNETLRELTKKQIKVIDYCKEHEVITEREVTKLVNINAEKEDIMKKAIGLFGKVK